MPARPDRGRAAFEETQARRTDHVRVRGSGTHFSTSDVQRPVFADGAAEHGAIAQVQPVLHDGPRLLVIARAAVLDAVAERTELLLLHGLQRTQASAQPACCRRAAQTSECWPTQ